MPISKSEVPARYVDQMQTGLALSGVKKALFVDAAFRMCSWSQIPKGVQHNRAQNGKGLLNIDCYSHFAWGVCYIVRKQQLEKRKPTFFDLGKKSVSFAVFEKVLRK